MSAAVTCSNCLQHFSGGHHYSQHRASCNGDNKQCPVCREWFTSQGQRDQHVSKSHVEVRGLSDITTIHSERAAKGESA